MAGRQKLGGFDTDYAKTPGPAVYTVMNPDNYQKKAPAYSMLSRQFMPGGTYQDIINLITIVLHNTNFSGFNHHKNVFYLRYLTILSLVTILSSLF